MGRQDIINFINKKYNANPEYLWRRYPDFCVFRRADNKKWFALCATLSRGVLKISGDGDVEIKASDFAECPFKVQGKGGGSAGTVDYNTQVENKPKINNITVSGNKTFSDYGLEWVEPDVVSDIFDGTETINENDYVMYNNKLYKCTNEHTGAWDADDFELITIMDAIISGGSSSVNVIDEPTAAEIAASVAEIWG